MSSTFSWSHDYTSLLPESQRHLLSRTTTYRRIIAAALLAAVLLLTYALGTGDGAGDASHTTTPPTQAEIEDATRPLFFSLLIPGGKKQDLETCRTILSAQVLNYPIPQILPLDSSSSQPRDEGQVNENGVDKEVTETQPPTPAVVWVEAILKWLGRTPPEGEDGIVLLLDEPGVYFQLRPQVLLQRYYRILTEADESARATRMEDVKKRVHHSIVFPAATSCRLIADDNEDATCDAAPDLKSKTLGEGYMMGPVKDIRQLLTRTLVALNQDPSASVHNIFTTLYTEQLLHRQTQVDQNWFTFNQDPELGITLDTTSLLSTSISPSTNKSTWKTLSTLPPEITESTPPYWTVFGSEPTLPHTATWSSILLFHPSSSTPHSPPLLLHPPSTPPSQRTQTWKSLFYHPHARTLYTAAQHLPSTIVASIPVFASDGRTRLGDRTFWNRKAKPDTAGAFNGGLKKGLQVGDALEEDFWPWRDMCGGEAEVEGVFGDGKGAWVGGRFY
ncbi:unnamed protein product [Zymoseptoria tritici ST99CH_3D1]|nr:unnamed protein product [Zymoseptoria tritici ST99CH_3D1]